MKAKKSSKKEIVLKSDLSFDEMIEGAFNDKTLKKDEIEPAVMMLLLQNAEEESKKPAKKASKKAAKKSK